MTDLIHTSDSPTHLSNGNHVPGQTLYKAQRVLTPYHQFPSDFLWGVAAAAFQIEGANKADGRGESIWDRLCERPGAIRNGDTGEVACDHFHRYDADFALMASLNIRNYRFSFAWPRIFPEGRGRINAKGLDFYDALIDSMLSHGIKPTATCYHWDLPQALEDKGGWRNRETAYAFAEFAAVLAERYSDRIDVWSTLNEPWCSWWLGHHEGIHAPGSKDRGQTLYNVAHHLLLAHGLGSQALRAHSKNPQLKVGLVHNSNNPVPFTESAADIDATRAIWRERNGWLLDPLFLGRYPEAEWNRLGKDAPVVHEGDMATIHQALDYLGLNVYFSDSVIRAGEAPQGFEPHYPRTDFNWPITPEAIYWTLRFAHEVYSPTELFITENGCCYPDDINAQGRVEDFARLNYVKENLKCLHRATQEGIPLNGYYLWSVFDNFEWAEGYSKRFGIIHVNFNNQRRTPKASALWYKHVMEHNGF
jgi:beta-glucosidase